MRLKLGLAAIVAALVVIAGIMLQLRSENSSESAAEVLAQPSTPLAVAVVATTRPADTPTATVAPARDANPGQSGTGNTPLPASTAALSTASPTRVAPPPASAPVTQTSEEGSVTIKVTWQGPATGPVFVVTMDTHSVALDGYDLATLSSLATDKGVVVSPSSWEAPRGGHHRKGTLSFPEVAPNGAPVLDPGTQYLELTIRDVDGVAERTFRWEV